MEALEILQDNAFLLLYGGVIMLSVVAALYLLLRRGNAIAPEVKSPLLLRRWASAFLGAFALSHVFWLFYAVHPSLTAYAIVCGLDILMLFPTIAGILMSMFQDRHRHIWPMMAAMAPAIVLVALCVIRGDDVLYLPLSIYAILLYASLILYAFFELRRYGKWLRDNYADLEHKEFWQSLLILAVFLLFFVMYSTTRGGIVLVYLLQIDCIIIVALLLWRVETLQQLGKTTSVEEKEPAEEEQKASSLPAATSKMGTLLKNNCEDRQLYLQNDLTLAQLANAIGTNRTYLSQYFAQQGITYNAYINGLRIRHFVRLYQEAVASGREITAQQLAFESGYRSYSTFSATFKQIMGTTATAWMNGVRE